MNGATATAYGPDAPCEGVWAPEMLIAANVRAITPSSANPARCTARQPAHFRGRTMPIIE